MRSTVVILLPMTTGCGRLAIFAVLALSHRTSMALGMSSVATGSHVRFVTNTKCPYAQRTWIALEETGADYEMVQVSLYGSGGKPAWFMELNPKGEVPVLVVDKKAIIGSEETVDYLMQGGHLSTEQRTLSTRWRSIVNERLKSSGKRAVFSGSEGDRQRLDAVLRDLNECLAQASEREAAGGAYGPFVCGADFNAADVSAFPFLQRVHGEFGFPHDCRLLEKWYSCASDRPCVKKTIKRDFWWWW